MNISGKIAFITGASSSLGEATVRLLSAQGATVALGARRHRSTRNTFSGTDNATDRPWRNETSLTVTKLFPCVILLSLFLSGCMGINQIQPAPIGSHVEDAPSPSGKHLNKEKDPSVPGR